MNQLSVRPEAGRGPAVLLIDPPLRRVEPPRRSIERPRAEVSQEANEGTSPLERRRLVGRANLQRPELGMRSHIPPEARVRARQPGRDHVLDERLPLRI